MRKNIKGFTLIELMVVISIIGTLSTVVVGSLSSARDEAKYAKVKLLMRDLRTDAELYYIDNGNYASGVYSGCPTTASGTPISFFETVGSFKKLESLAELYGFDITDIHTEMECRVPANGQSYAISTWLGKLNSLGVNYFESLGVQITENRALICIDNEDGLARGIGSYEALNALTTGSSSTTYYKCLPDGAVFQEQQ